MGQKSNIKYTYLHPDNVLIRQWDNLYSPPQNGESWVKSGSQSTKATKRANKQNYTYNILDETQISHKYTNDIELLDFPSYF